MSASEKKSVALFSVFAAVFLTGSKLAIGLLTGSLGILSEALHSGLDFVATAITYFSVRIADRPADADHNFGHGKVENLSALVETLLLLVTCAWIVYEAAHRLLTGRVEIEVTYWSYIVVVVSIVIDFSRSRALMKAAKKYDSQALEADALHFSTDIWSSGVVLLGLVCANFGFYYADSIAALAVAVIVVFVCFRLGRSSIKVLLDTAPADHVRTVEDILKGEPRVLSFHDLGVRNSGADVFVVACIHVDSSLSIEEAHRISHEVERCIVEKIPRAVVHIHQEPDENNS